MDFEKQQSPVLQVVQRNIVVAPDACTNLQERDRRVLVDEAVAHLLVLRHLAIRVEILVSQLQVVAARDSEPGNRLVPGDAYDTTTWVLRVRGADLAAFRAGRLTLEEARKRVEVREF